MKDFSKLVKKTFKKLTEKNITPTPENYESEFYSLCEKEDVTLKEKIELDEIVNQLCDSEKDEFNTCETQSFKKLSLILSKRINQHEAKQFLLHLSYLMSPSLSKEVKSEIDKFCTEISDKPNKLINIDSIRKLRYLTDVRIENDNILFEEKTTDVIKLIDFLGGFFNKTLNENYITIEKIKELKKEINTLELSESSSLKLSDLNTRLMNLIEEFENTVNKNNLSILKSQKEKDQLEEQIEKLKENLVKAEEEKSIDYLTNVLTRRAYSIEIERIENEYNVFDSKYAIIFYDIDFFKNINDTYGHECGDKVLTTFASILKKLTRSEDIISRYGGEEFICIVHYNNTIEINNYLRRVKNIIGNNKFVCENNRINVKFSAGVSFRNSYNSYEETLRAADSALYKAKDTGRDKIVLENGNVFK